MIKKLAVAGLGMTALLYISGCGQPEPAKLPTQSAATSATATAASTAVAIAPKISTGTEGRVSEAPAVAETAEGGSVGTTAPQLEGKTWVTSDHFPPKLTNRVYLVDFWSIT